MKKIFICVIAFLMFACGNSVEKQQSAWESNKGIVNSYSSKYPFFAAAIKDQFSKAEKAMNEAQSISDEEKKMEAMTAANKLCTSGAINALRSVESEVSDIKREIDKIKRDFHSDEFSRKTTFLLEEGKEMINKAEDALKSEFSSVENAISELNSLGSELSQINRDIDSHYSEVMRSRPDEKAQSEAVTNSSNSKPEEKNTSSSPKPTSIKCNKCGGLLKSDMIKCKNCGAPVKK